MVLSIERGDPGPTDLAVIVFTFARTGTMRKNRVVRINSLGPENADDLVTRLRQNLTTAR